MRRFALKALLSMLVVNRATEPRRDWDRIILIFTTAATIGLAALYGFGKATSRF